MSPLALNAISKIGVLESDGQVDGAVRKAKHHYPLSIEHRIEAVTVVHSPARATRTEDPFLRAKRPNVTAPSAMK